ncbi:MAG: DUF3768 domain-containing protein [Dehalococcoidia bacterium]|nr:DUF3768 domain-containing protein [Dehalococcoidia bacterium]
MAQDYVGRVRELNDRFRKSFEGGHVLITRGVEATGYVSDLLDRVRTFDSFTPDNDPYGEHDFGSFSLRGQDYFWKIDYYDPELRFHSEDKADPARTQRVLTVMRADEY